MKYGVEFSKTSRKSLTIGKINGRYVIEGKDDRGTYFTIMLESNELQDFINCIATAVSDGKYIAEENESNAEQNDNEFEDDSAESEDNQDKSLKDISSFNDLEPGVYKTRNCVITIRDKNNYYGKFNKSTSKDKNNKTITDNTSEIGELKDLQDTCTHIEDHELQLSFRPRFDNDPKPIVCDICNK